MDKNFKGRKEFEKILIKLDKWNEKYNSKSKHKYLAISCVDGNWLGNNDTTSGTNHFDFFIDEKEMAEMREGRIDD